MIGQLLSVNETLVNQLSQRGVTPAGTVRTEARSKIPGTKKKRSLSAPRPSSTTEAPVAQASGRVGKVAKERKSTTRAIASGSGGGGLHEMHEMYVSLAKQITGKDPSSSGQAQSGGTGKKKRITSMKQRALKGKSHPSLADDQSFASSAFDTLSRKSIGSSAAPPHTTSASELQGVIQSLEEEFEMLNSQYQQLLQPKKLGATSGYGPEDRSRELVSVIQRLHKKGEQLRALKSSPQKGGG